jgi:hypothetical protein
MMPAKPRRLTSLSQKPTLESWSCRANAGHGGADGCRARQDLLLSIAPRGSVRNRPSTSVSSRLIVSATITADAGADLLAI